MAILSMITVTVMDLGYRQLREKAHNLSLYVVCCGRLCHPYITSTDGMISPAGMYRICIELLL